MNYRERMLSAINHKEPDHVPIDLGATTSSGISAVAYSNLIKHLNMPSCKNRVYDVVQQVTQPDMAILDLVHAGALDIGRVFNTEDSEWHKVTLCNGEAAEYPIWFNPVLHEDGSYHALNDKNELIAKMIRGATFFDQTFYPYIDGYPDKFSNLPEAMSKVNWSAFGQSPWDHLNDENFWTKLREKTIELRNNTDRAIVIAPGCNLFEWGTYLRRMDNFLMDLLTEPEKVEELLDALMEIHMNTLKKMCDAVGDIVDVVRFCDDLGTDRGPFMDPEIYRALFKPRHKMLCDYVHKNSNAHTFIHCCGAIYRVIPDLIEAGIEIINPVQTVSSGMDPVRLKKEFGNDVVFWGGGSDTRNILNRGTPQQVKDDVKKNIEIFAPGGGFVFNTIHNIMPDVPPENVVAMFEAANEY